MSRIIGTILALLLGFVTGVPAQDDVMQILQRMNDALEPGRDMRAAVEFVIDNEKGERVRWMGTYVRMSEPARKRFVLDHPADLRGVAVTLEGTPSTVAGVRIYLPFVRRVRTISDEMRGASFMGSDFNFEDLGFVDLEYQQHTLLGPEQADGRRCWRVDSRPTRTWWYGRISRCIDQEDYLPRTTRYYTPGDMLYKVRTMEVARIGGYATPVRMTMEVVPAHTETTLTLSEIEYDTGLSLDLFTDP